MKKYYDLLGISPDASDNEIKSAYRNLVKKYHPDVGGDAKQFNEVTEAYDILKSETTRTAYRATSGPQYNPFNNHDQYSSSSNTNDILYEYLRQSGFSYQRPVRNQNLRLSVEIPLRSILNDQTHTIKVDTGTSIKNLTITIPKGVSNAAGISYAGFGSTVIAGVPPGDLHIEVNISPDKQFSRRGSDLISNVELDCLDAIIGCDLTFVSIWGKKLKLKIPPGTQSGTVLRLAGHGLPNMRDDQIGDQLVTVNVTVPTNLTKSDLIKIKQIKGKK